MTPSAFLGTHLSNGKLNLTVPVPCWPVNLALLLPIPVVPPLALYVLYILNYSFNYVLTYS